MTLQPLAPDDVHPAEIRWWVAFDDAVDGVGDANYSLPTDGVTVEDGDVYVEP